jgi:hypothetical protein
MKKNSFSFISFLGSGCGFSMVVVSMDLPGVEQVISLAREHTYKSF